MGVLINSDCVLFQEAGVENDEVFQVVEADTLDDVSRSTVFQIMQSRAVNPTVVTIISGGGVDLHGFGSLDRSVDLSQAVNGNEAAPSIGHFVIIVGVVCAPKRFLGGKLEPDGKDNGSLVVIINSFKKDVVAHLHYVPPYEEN